MTRMGGVIVQVESVRFGALNVDDDKIILFPRGIPGFEDAGRFFLMDHAGSSRVKWLHSVDNPGLALVVADPFDLFDDYRPDLPDEIAVELSIASPDDALVLTVLTVRAGLGKGEPPTITANLLAPIVISKERRIGAQALLKAGEYGVRHEVSVLPGSSGGSGGSGGGGHSGSSCGGGAAGDSSDCAGAGSADAGCGAAVATA